MLQTRENPPEMLGPETTLVRVTTPEEEPGSTAVSPPWLGLGSLVEIESIGSIVHVVDALANRNQAEERAGSGRVARIIQ